MKFEYLLLAAALGMAGVGAYFSIVGIATLFGSAMIAAGIMASIIEFSKVVGTTFLYRYWNKSLGFLKIYLCISVFVLMVLTSVGIYGFLGSAYQKSAFEFKINQEKIALVENQKTYLSDKIFQAKSRIDTLNKMRALQESRMNDSLTNAFLTRSPIQFKQLQDQTAEMIKSADANITTEQDIIQKSTDNIAKINQEVNEMRFASANKKDIRTFQFVAEQFGTTLDVVAKWFILAIIFVFDPLAIALILAYNVATYKTTKELTNANNLEKLPIVNLQKPTNSNILNNSEIVDLYPKPVTNLTSSASNTPPVFSGKSIDSPPPRPHWL